MYHMYMYVLQVCLRNVLLCKGVTEYLFPPPDATLMAAILTCVEFMTMALIFVLFVVHTTVWLASPRYRKLHDTSGLMGLYRSIGEHIVRSMIKAGEITFRRRASPLDKTTDEAGK